MNWRRAAESLQRLASDQVGKPEGLAAQIKLDLIRSKHPEAFVMKQPTPLRPDFSDHVPSQDPFGPMSGIDPRVQVFIYQYGVSQGYTGNSTGYTITEDMLNDLYKKFSF